MTPRPRTTHPDPRLRVTVVSAVPMMYRDGPDPSVDRPGWVRAASGLAWWHGALAVVQDDTHIVAHVDPNTGLAEALLLPASEGVRQFGTDRGNKAAKADLECCLVLPDGGLVGFGSGSTLARRRVVRIDDPESPPRLFEAPGLYAALKAHPGFSGSELNLEGVCPLGDRLWLFQRGNGAPRDGRSPCNATATLALDAFVDYLRRAEVDPTASLGADLRDVTHWDLGRIDGVPWTFTDAAPGPPAGSPLPRDGVAWIAAAEASPNTYDDGANLGVALGYLTAAGEAGYARIVGADGAPETRKGEGLAFCPGAPDLAWMVVDLDDPSRPAELLTLRLSEA